MSDTPRTDAVARINEYLGVGGLFNPEILNVQQHEAVRDTLIQARDELTAANERIKRLEEDLGDAYAEMRKQHHTITAVYDRSVWTKAKESNP